MARCFRSESFASHLDDLRSVPGHTDRGAGLPGVSQWPAAAGAQGRRAVRCPFGSDAHARTTGHASLRGQVGVVGGGRVGANLDLKGRGVPDC